MNHMPELPLNRSGVYTSVTSASGCEIYIPVLNASKLEVEKTQSEFKTFLKSISHSE